MIFLYNYDQGKNGLENEKLLFDMAEVDVDYPYWFKVRYYALLSLEKLENTSYNVQSVMEDFIVQSECIKNGIWLKADQSVNQYDIQSTFQYDIIRMICKGNYKKYVR